MPYGVSLIEIHNRLLYIDGFGNLILNTKGNLAEQIKGGNHPQFFAAGTGATFLISAATAGANTTVVSFQVRDGIGDNVAGVFNFEVYLSDESTGAGLTGTTASGAVSADGGIVRSILTAKKDFLVQTDATGLFNLVIIDSAKTHFYPVAVMSGMVSVGDQLTTGDYG